MSTPEIKRLFEAKRRWLEAEAQALDVDDEAALLLRLQDAIKGTEALPDLTERHFRLQVLAELLGKVGDRDATRELLRLLNSREPSVRATVLEQLERLTRRGRTAEVMWAVDQTLDGELQGVAAAALPALLLTASLDEESPPPLDLLVRIADHEDPAPCAEALCALAEFEGNGITELLSSFTDDERALPRQAGEPATIGELARQLLMVREMEADIGDRGDPGDRDEDDIPLA